MLNRPRILWGQSAGCRRILSQKGLSEDIKGYPPLWRLEALGLLPRVQWLVGEGEGTMLTHLLHLCTLKKNYLSHGPYRFLNCPFPK